jgi:hypothetical protein
MRRLVVVGLALAAVLLAVAGTAVALRARIVASGTAAAGAVKQVKTEWSENLVGTSTVAWAPVGSVTITVPTGQKDLVDVRFDGNAYCDPNTPGVGSGQCQLRFVAKGATNVPLRPQTMNTVLEVADPGVGQDDYSLSMEKSRVLGAGTWTIVVQHRVTDPSIYFGIYAHHITVERAPV